MADQPRVVFPLYEGSTLLDFAGATQIFSFAGYAPGQAPPEVTASVRQSQGDFIAAIRLATEKVLGKI